MPEKRDRIANWILGTTSFWVVFTVMLTAFAMLGACTVPWGWFPSPLARDRATLTAAAICGIAIAALSVLAERKIRKHFGILGSTLYFGVLIAAMSLFVRTQYIWVLSLM